MMAIVSSFYNFLIQEEYTLINPMLLIRQKSKYFRKQQNKTKVRRLSELQWGYLIETTEIMANENPVRHERSLFMMNALYSMYLRISELVATERWTPEMADFERDHDGLWWFTTVGKGNKKREIAVSNAMMKAFKRYRKYLKLSALPSPGEKMALVKQQMSTVPITSTRYIRFIVQECFDRSIERLEQDNLKEESSQLMAATVHWLRHTGISDDVKLRPREHVRDDAGHSSSAITDKYIDIELRERHSSKKRQRIKPECIEE